MLPDPAAALAEARRVLAPGGRIVLAGQDWDTILTDSGLPEVTRRIVHARADTIEQPRIARAYRSLLLDHGFGDVPLVVHTAVFTDPGARQLLTSHADAAREHAGRGRGVAGRPGPARRERPAAARDADVPDRRNPLTGRYPPTRRAIRPPYRNLPSSRKVNVE
ncbi:hypothetical protein [Paractinoplanes lichenicola]|uniref:Methyltransferase type 11 domain-containing protein n=1 Tax=Paractinoplanes lichenicola TaxID=2802976 RepID=A0ABS1VUN8_9ACTN|nr:hypothetical protein [Actinoplanes lichenicola]MBL7258199.1 hypothetical protein [Actinoplanes lichenicola]